MDRTGRFPSPAYQLAAALAFVVVAATGCNIIATGLHVWNDRDAKAEYKGLEGKRVAIVCRSLPTLQYRLNGSVGADLAKDVGRHLRTNMKKKINLIEQKEVAHWTDENNWEDFTEIGEALKADQVVAIELEEFNLYEGQTLYRGKATVKLTVYDMKNGGEEVFDKHLPQTLYPPNVPITATEMPEAQFRRMFVAHLAEQIARHFYDYNSSTDVAADSKVYRH